MAENETEKAKAAAAVEWFYEVGGSPRGPVSASELAELLRSGRLEPTARIWHSGLSDWQPACETAEFRDASPAPTMPAAAAAAALPVAARPPAPQEPRLAPPENVAALILLGVVTLGIYPLVRFYQVARSYWVLAHERTEEFMPMFAAFVICSGLAALLMIIGVGILFWLAAIVLGALLLNRVLATRDHLVAQRGLQVQLTRPGTHIVLWIVGQLTTPAGIGVVLVIVQTALFFSDHNAIAAAMGLAPPESMGSRQLPIAATAPAPVPVAAAGTPPPSPGPTRSCAACGEPLGAAAAHFCSNCGARVSG